MILSPDGVSDRIGLDRVRRRLEELAQSTPTVEAIRDLRPNSDRNYISRRLSIAGELQACLSFGDSIPFAATDDLRPIVDTARPHGATLSAESILEVCHTVRTARLVGSFIQSRSDRYPSLADEWSDLNGDREFEAAVERVFDDDGNVKDNASAELRRIRKDLNRAKQSLRTRIHASLALAIENGYAAEEQPTIRSGRMVIPVTASSKKRLAGFVHDVSATGQTVFIEPQDCLDLNNRIREIEIEESREIETLRRALTDQIRERSEMIIRNGELLIQFDLSLSIARLANELSATVPQLNDEGIIHVIDGRNPELLLVYRSQGREQNIVPLNVELGASFHTLVISGPNAGGKSIAMKSIGLMTAMLGMGIPVPASEESTFCLFSRVMTDIGDAQSVEDDLSTYSSHLTNLGAMLREADDNTLVLIDEAGTGTDPDEGAALAQAVLEALTARGSRTVVTTHHGALKVFAHDEKMVANGSMAFDLETLKPTFQFRLHVPGASYAADIASKVGLSDDVVSRARQLVGKEKVKLESLISSLEKTNQKLEERLADATSIHKAAVEDRQKLEDRLHTLQSGKDEIEKRAVEEAQDIIQTANRLVERVVREIKEAQAESSRTKKARAELERTRDQLTEESKRLRKRETARKSVQTTLSKTAKSKRSAKAKATKIGVGDRVVLDGGSNVGKILSLKGDEATIALGHLQTRVTLSRITKIGPAEEQRVMVRHASGPGSAASTATLEHRLDLRGCRVDEAISRVVRLIDEATAANLHRVEILHGKGTGALRQAIHEYLEGSDFVTSFEQADWDEGGDGVTIVVLSA